MKSILFVCLGNICRSPAAEGIMRHLVEIHGMQHDIKVDSAGIGSWHVGDLPDPRMRTLGKKHGYLFTSRARQFVVEDFDRYQLIVAMDQENVMDLKSKSRTPYDKAKIVCMADYLRHHPMHKTVPDPYYGGEQGFELVIDLLEDACQGLLESLMKKNR